MQVLYVCTANICRSAAAQRLLEISLASERARAMPGSQVERLLGAWSIRSAGVAAIPDLPGCPIAPALQLPHPGSGNVPGAPSDHRSTRLDAQLVAAADLILAADRGHRDSILRLDPRARTRTFTVRQAGRIAAWLCGPAGMLAAGAARASEPDPEDRHWRARFAQDDPRGAVAPMPPAGDVAARWQWFIGELDAGRSNTPASTALAAGDPKPPATPATGAPARASRWLRDRWGSPQPDPRDRRETDSHAAYRGGHPDDLLDPHTQGIALHDLVDSQLRQATGELVAAMVAVASA